MSGKVKKGDVRYWPTADIPNAPHMSAFGGNRTVIAQFSVIDHDSARTVIGLAMP